MEPRDRTRTSAFGVGRREGHDASAFYERFTPPVLDDDESVNRPAELLDELGRGRIFLGSSTDMHQLPDNSVALVVTSPPYFVGKDYELVVTGEVGDGSRIPKDYFEFLTMLEDVFRECTRVLEPGGRIAVNVANLGRKPYRSLSADVIGIFERLGLLLRGEVIWEKAASSSGSCAWGSFGKASNPVLRDVTERVIIASKGRFARAITPKERRKLHLPHESTIANDEFVDVTKDVWRIDAESATRIGHPAPFPVELPRRLIDLYTYVDDLVLDPFAGSGTTLVAAARTGRIGVGYDTDATYQALAERRLHHELARAARLRAVDHDAVGALGGDERQDHFQTLAVREGKKVHDIAHRSLVEAGFTVDPKPRHPAGVVDFEFRAGSAASPSRWWVDVPGAFTTARPGLQRADVLWRLLGRLHVAGATRGADASDRGVIVLTPSIPKPGTPGHQALRAVGPAAIWDVVELYDRAGLDRLRYYATASDPVQLPGFWSAGELRAGELRTGDQ